MALHGKNTVVKVDNRAGSLIDLSAYIKNETLSQQADSHEVTTFTTATGAAVSRIPGLKDGTFDIDGVFDPTADAILCLIVGQQCTFEVGPQGSTSGNTKYTGESLCLSYSVDSPVDGEQTWSASFQMTDDCSKTTY